MWQPRSVRASLEATVRHFDRWAHTYERDPSSRVVGIAQRETLAALRLRADDRFLDVGCGTGAAVREAAKSAAQATGLDLSPKMVERARELAHGAGNVDFVEGSSAALPFDDGAFTALLCTTSFHHYPEPRQALLEMGRVLAPGGRLALGDASGDLFAMRLVDRFARAVQRGHVGFYRFAELAEWLRAAGFERIERVRRWGGIYAIVTAVKAAP